MEQWFCLALTSVDAHVTSARLELQLRANSSRKVVLRQNPNADLIDMLPVAKEKLLQAA